MYLLETAKSRSGLVAAAMGSPAAEARWLRSCGIRGTQRQARRVNDRLCKARWLHSACSRLGLGDGWLCPARGYGGDAGLGDAVARADLLVVFPDSYFCTSATSRRSGSASNGVAGPGCVTGVAASVTRECVSAGHCTFLLVRPGSSTFLLPPRWKPVLTSVGAGLLVSRSEPQDALCPKSVLPLRRRTRLRSPDSVPRWRRSPPTPKSCSTMRADRYRSRY